MVDWWWLIITLSFGASVGLLVAAVCAASAQADKYNKRGIGSRDSQNWS